jgi:AbrB family looped-hinge helix DNA binding protein
MPKISSGGRVTIPLQIRAALRLHSGDNVEFVAMEEEFVMVAATPRRGRIINSIKGKSSATANSSESTLPGRRKAKLVVSKPAI